MGFLSKLFGGDKAVEKAAKSILSNILNGTSDNTAQKTPEQNIPESPAPQDWAESYDDSPSGVSYGSRMPAEENQFNYGGSFTEYFESVFSSCCPDLRYEKSVPGGSRRVIYVFYAGMERVLVVEVMSEKCSAKKLRNDCRRSGTPYLRFYYDHHGWWNTRSYVSGRITAALGR